MVNKTVLAMCMATALLAGCKAKDTAAEAAPEAATAAAPEATAAPEPAPEATPAAPAATAAAVAFDISKIPVSDKPLPAWPYVALAAGYHYDNNENLAEQSKDLARVPVWTGGQLLWVEGKTFSDQIDNSDGKTFSKFEVRKSLQQAIEALGGVRLAERSFDEATYKANEKALDDFRQEFHRIRDAYWYDADADTYVIRRADKAIWIVAQIRNDDAGIMVAEGPLPEAPAQ